MITASISASFTNTSGGLIEVEKTPLVGSKTVLASVAAGQSGSISATLALGDKVKVSRAGSQAFSIAGSGTLNNDADASVVFTSQGSPAVDAAAVTASASVGFSFALAKANDQLELKVA